jgi:hypothetical protein
MVVCWSYLINSVEKSRTGETNKVSMKHDKYLTQCFARGCVGGVRLLVRALGSFFTIPVLNGSKAYQASYSFGTGVFHHYKMVEHYCFRFN